VKSDSYYGTGYQDIMTRKPSIKNARQKLGWSPQVSMDDALNKTLDFYLKNRKLAAAIRP
jgi:nucleoside-diphosphate-sugar epimerase